MPSVSFVCSVVPVLMILHRNIKIDKNHWLPKLDNYRFVFICILTSSGIMEQSYNIVLIMKLSALHNRNISPYLLVVSLGRNPLNSMQKERHSTSKKVTNNNTGK